MPDKIQLKRDTFAVGCIAFPALPDVSLFYALLYAFHNKNIPDAKRFFGLVAAGSFCALIEFLYLLRPARSVPGGPARSGCFPESGKCRGAQQGKAAFARVFPAELFSLAAGDAAGHHSAGFRCVPEQRSLCL